MSVPAPKRNEASTLFVYNARELYKFTLMKTKRNSKAKKDDRYENIIPACYYDGIGKKLTDRADQILMHVIAGNRIYPLNQEEVQIRRNHFLRALSYADDYDAILQVANEIIGIETETFKSWSKLIADEIRLLVAVIKADRDRYKHIGENPAK